MKNKVDLNDTLGALIANLNIELVQGVSNEIDHFMPDGWSWSTEGDAFRVDGPWSRWWLHQVRQLCGVLSYRMGSMFLSVVPGHLEFYTWRNAEGDGFKVIFIAEDMEESFDHSQIEQRRAAVGAEMFAVYLRRDDGLVSLGRFHFAEGLEGRDDEEGVELVFHHGSPNTELISQLKKRDEKDLVIELCDMSGQAMVTYDTGQVHLELREVYGSTALIASNPYRWPLMRRGALYYWRARRVALPVRIGTWMHRSREAQLTWLSVCMQDQRRNMKPQPSPIELEGGVIHDMPSFYCALAEAVFGPGGYIGWNLSALYDCLTGTMVEDGIRPLTELIWKNAGSSKAAIIERDGMDTYETLIKVLHDAGVKVVM